MCLYNDYLSKYVPKEDPIYAWKMFHKGNNGILLNLFKDDPIELHILNQYGANTFIEYRLPTMEYETYHAYRAKKIRADVAYYGFHAHSSRSQARFEKRYVWFKEKAAITIRKVKLWGKIYFDDNGQLAGEYMEILPIRG